MMRSALALVLPTVLLAGLPAASADAAPGVSAAHADLGPASGSDVSATVVVKSLPEGGVHIDVHATGLTPGVHGFHVHEDGDCSAPDASSAKAHFNPTRQPHGHHAGDLPDLAADSNGVAQLSADVPVLELGDGANSILNRAFIIHADPDDHKSQPSGNSGKRVACGVIKAG